MGMRLCLDWKYENGVVWNGNEVVFGMESMGMGMCLEWNYGNESVCGFHSPGPGTSCRPVSTTTTSCT